MENPCEKSPISILQEYTDIRKLRHPAYSFDIDCKTGEFICKIVVADVNEFGRGSNKRIAKHDAAEKALKRVLMHGSVQVERKRYYGPENYTQVSLACEGPESTTIQETVTRRPVVEDAPKANSPKEFVLSKVKVVQVIGENGATKIKYIAEENKEVLPKFSSKLVDETQRCTFRIEEINTGLAANGREVAEIDKHEAERRRILWEHISKSENTAKGTSALDGPNEGETPKTAALGNGVVEDAETETTLKDLTSEFRKLYNKLELLTTHFQTGDPEAQTIEKPTVSTVEKHWNNQTCLRPGFQCPQDRQNELDIKVVDSQKEGASIIKSATRENAIQNEREKTQPSIFKTEKMSPRLSANGIGVTEIDKQETEIRRPIATGWVPWDIPFDNETVFSQSTPEKSFQLISDCSGPEKHIIQQMIERSPISVLQEYCAKYKAPLPTYKFFPNYKNVGFTCEVEVMGICETAEAIQKQLAKTKAAEAALKKILYSRLARKNALEYAAAETSSTEITAECREQTFAPPVRQYSQGELYVLPPVIIVNPIMPKGSKKAKRRRARENVFNNIMLGPKLPTKTQDETQRCSFKIEEIIPGLPPDSMEVAEVAKREVEIKTKKAIGLGTIARSKDQFLTANKETPSAQPTLKSQGTMPKARENVFENNVLVPKLTPEVEGVIPELSTDCLGMAEGDKQEVVKSPQFLEEGIDLKTFAKSKAQLLTSKQETPATLKIQGAIPKSKLLNPLPGTRPIILPAPLKGVIQELRKLCKQRGLPSPNIATIDQSCSENNIWFRAACDVGDIKLYATADEEHTAHEKVASLMLHTIRENDGKGSQTSERKPISNNKSKENSNKADYEEIFKLCRKFGKGSRKKEPSGHLWDRHYYFKTQFEDIKKAAFAVLQKEYESDEKKAHDIFRALELEPKITYSNNIRKPDDPLVLIEFVDCPYDAVFLGVKGEVYKRAIEYFEVMLN